MDIPRGIGTRGIEASQYPQEKKSIEMPLVKAIEKGKGQTESSNDELEEMWIYGLVSSLTRPLEVLWKRHNIG